MKNLIVLIAVLFVFASCHNYKKDIQSLQIEKDSLLKETKIKDTSILSFLNGYNEIQANLDSIKKIEKMVAIQTIAGQELDIDQKTMILEDIQSINGLLLKNKELIASLNRRLKSSSNKIVEHELMLANLKNQNMEKDLQISRLNEDLQNLDLNIGQLHEIINTIEPQNKQKSQTIELQTNEMNRAFIALGSKKVLKEEGILQVKGGFLGIGRTPIIENDFNQAYFTPIDIRNFDYIPLGGVKKAKLLSIHPASSFHISGEKKADTLFIDNKSDFWKVTNYLIVSAD